MGHDFETSAERDGLPVAYSLIGAPGWLGVDPATGEVSGTPPNCTAGDMTVTVRAEAGAGIVAEHPFALHVLNVAPVFLDAPPDLWATEDAAFAHDFDTDDEGVGLGVTYYLPDAPDWLSIDASTGVISGIPLNHDGDVVEVAILAEDTHGGVSDHLVSLHIANAAPVFVEPPAALEAPEDAITVCDFDTDDEAGEVTYSLAGAPDWLELVDASLGIVEALPRDADVGDHAVTLRATDAYGGRADHGFVLHVTNAPPDFLNDPGTLPASEGQTLVYNFDTDDESDGPGVTYEVVGGPEWLVVEDPSTGEISGTPLNAVPGEYTVTVRASDLHGGATDLDVLLLVTNATPSVELHGPYPGAQVLRGGEFEARWTAEDPDSDAVLTLFWDLDADCENNTAGTEGVSWGPIAAGIPERDASESLPWTVDLPTGADYHIGARIDDRATASVSYASETLHVSVIVQRASLAAEGITVGIYDASPGDGESLPDVAWSRREAVRGETDIVVDFGRDGDGSLKGITLLGDGADTAGIGIVVSGATDLGAFRDARRSAVKGGALSEIAFFSTDCAVRSVASAAGLAGANLNGLRLGGRQFPADIDGDGEHADASALLTGGPLSKAKLTGAVHGDLMVGGSDAKGLAVRSMGIRGGSLLGDAVLAGSAGRIALEGDLPSTLHVAGDLKGLVLRGGNLDGGVVVDGWAGTISVAAARSRGDGVWTGGSLGPDGWIVVNGSNAPNGLSLGQVSTKGGGFLGRVDVLGGLAKISVRGGDVAGEVNAGTDLGLISVKGAMDRSVGGVVGGNVLDATFAAVGLFKGLSVSGDVTDSTVNAGVLGRVSVKGVISESEEDGELDCFYASAGSFAVRDSTYKGVVSAGSEQWIGGLRAYVKA